MLTTTSKLLRWFSAFGVTSDAIYLFHRFVWMLRCKLQRSRWSHPLFSMAEMCLVNSKSEILLYSMQSVFCSTEVCAERVSALCFLPVVWSFWCMTPFCRPSVGTDADKLQVCPLINDTSSAAVSVRDNCLILKTRRTLICCKSFKNLKPMTKHLFIWQITKLIN